MEGNIRVTARTVDNAVTEALIQLEITSDRLEYKVIEKGSSGFLGIGMKQAVIEAKVKSETAEDTKVQMKNEIPEVKKESAPVVDNKEEKNRQEIKPPIELVQVKEDTKKAVESFLEDTLKAMGMNVELISDIDKSGSLSVNMKGEDMGILIGKRGQTLDALQYLANRVANKHQDGYVRVKLDTENYRKRREETLKNLAKNIAFKVKRSRKPVSLEPMNPYERRIIHSTLQEDSYVTTHSEGDEPYRKVVVTLKK